MLSLFTLHLRLYKVVGAPGAGAYPKTKTISRRKSQSAINLGLVALFSILTVYTYVILYHNLPKSI